MNHLFARRARALAPLVAGLAALVVAASACAQRGGGSDGGGNRAAAARTATPPLDSLLSRASNARQHGSQYAKVTIYEVSDFQCPYCKMFFDSTYAKFDSAYVRTGKVRLVFINFPLPMHNQAFAASKAAMCAGAQGKFWEMHDRLFQRQHDWRDQADAPQRFAAYARELGVNAAQFRDCVDNDRISSLVVNDVMQASGAQVNSTPTFILNREKILPGAIPFAELAREVDALLAAAGQGTSPAGAPPAGAPPAATPPAAPARP
ncbi:MAG TPA: thioredoxin domain-containing protein [Longimicrobium sp.]|nr:thioredoxin domain-containing protein [Longimicrobium sp.]